MRLQVTCLAVNLLAARDVTQMLSFTLFVRSNDWWQSRQLVDAIWTSTASTSSLCLRLGVVLKLKAVGFGERWPALRVQGRCSGRCRCRVGIGKPRFRVIIGSRMVLMIWWVSVRHWRRSRLSERGAKVANWIKWASRSELYAYLAAISIGWCWWKL